MMPMLDTCFCLEDGMHGPCKSDGSNLHPSSYAWGREAAPSPRSRISRPNSSQSQSPWPRKRALLPLLMFPPHTGRAVRFVFLANPRLPSSPSPRKEQGRREKQEEFRANFSGKPREQGKGSSLRHLAKTFHSLLSFCVMHFGQGGGGKIHLVHVKDHLLLKQILGWPGPVFSLT